MSEIRGEHFESETSLFTMRNKKSIKLLFTTLEKLSCKYHVFSLKIRIRQLNLSFNRPNLHAAQFVRLKRSLHTYRAHRKMERVFPNRNASKWERNRLFGRGTRNYLAKMDYMAWENNVMKFLSFILGNQAAATWRLNGRRKLMAFEHKKYHFP